MDKAQGSRPLDKAFLGDPELLERGPPEQQVTLGGGTREGGPGGATSKGERLGWG